MLIAKNSKGEMVNILESMEGENYYCFICGENLTRNFGLKKQYYSHPKNKGNNCELKLKLLLKEKEKEYDKSDIDILNNEYYNKNFNNVKIGISDYMDENGHYLTQEQKDIIFSKEDKIKISALAGSGKSHTLYYYAKERPNKKILYLVYNKSMKEEADKSFGKLKNVEIKTIHGLAYKYYGFKYRHKLTFNYNAVDIIKDLKLNWTYDQELAVKVNIMMQEYMLSEYENFKELEIFEQDKNRSKIIHLCEQLWELKKDTNTNVKVEHDFYLKLFQLSQQDMSNNYDIILLDEAQDSSKLVLDVLNNSKVNNVVMVGDRFQMIYGWRKSVNVLELFNGKEYKLTTSFRVSQQTANISNLLIQDFDNGTKIDMKGFNDSQNIVNKIDKNKPYVCLCRTNSYIFAETIDAIENGKENIFYEGGYNSYKFNNILDCYNFSLGKQVKNNMFKKFKNYTQMHEYAKNTDDIELNSLIKVVEEYGSRIPSLISKIKNSTTTNKEKSDLILSTIHRSKGMTCKIPVVISDDHVDLENTFNKLFINKNTEDLDRVKLFEEVALVYVAITRASKELKLSDKLKQYLLLRYRFFKNNKAN